MRQYHRRCHRPVVAVTVAIAVAVTVAVAAVDITRCAALARAAAQITEAVREKETALRQLEDVKKGYADREVEMQRLRDEMASQEKAATLRTTTLAEKLHKMRVRAAVRVCVHVCMCVCSDVFADVSLCRRRWRRRRRSSRRRSWRFARPVRRCVSLRLSLRLPQRLSWWWSWWLSLTRPLHSPTCPAPRVLQTRQVEQEISNAATAEIMALRVR